MFTRSVPVSFYSMLLVALVANVHAENWPNWRGPSSSGVSSETGLPVTWSDTENVAWKAQFRGLGVSSPVVWGDRVFVTSQIGGGESLSGPRLFQAGDAAVIGERALGGGATNASAGTQSAAFLVTAFLAANGKQLWEFQLPSEGPLPPVHEKHNLASPSPVTDGQRVYAWFGTGQLVALDMNGKLVWKRSLAADFGPFDIQWGHGSSPALYKDMLILLSYQASNGTFAALDSATGGTRWKIPAPKGAVSYSTPCVVETTGTVEIVVNSSEGLAGHSVVNGERLWFIAEPSRFAIPVASPDKGIIYTSRGYRSGPFMAVRPGGKGDITKSHLLWKVESGAPYISSVIQYDGYIYMIGDVGVATVADAKTGERVWQERVGGVYTASPIAADGKVYFFSEDGETVVLSAGRDPRVLARNRLSARQLASPAISGGSLFIRGDSSLWAIRVPKGNGTAR
jgi:outer membrane protein assembly factor BamB